MRARGRCKGACTELNIAACFEHAMAHAHTFEHYDVKVARTSQVGQTLYDSSPAGMSRKAVMHKCADLCVLIKLSRCTTLGEGGGR